MCCWSLYYSMPVCLCSPLWISQPVEVQQLVGDLGPNASGIDHGSWSSGDARDDGKDFLRVV